MSRKKRLKNAKRKLRKAVEKRLQELYEDVDFRLQLEKETENITTEDEIREYQSKAYSLSKQDIKKNNKK